MPPVAESVCSKCGKWKRPQYDLCYPCNQKKKTESDGNEIVIKFEAQVYVPPPKIDLRSSDEKTVEAFDNDPHYGPRVHTNRLQRYMRLHRLGQLDNPSLLAAIQRTENKYVFDQQGVLVKKT